MCICFYFYFEYFNKSIYINCRANPTVFATQQFLPSNVKYYIYVRQWNVQRPADKQRRWIKRTVAKTFSGFMVVNSVWFALCIFYFALFSFSNSSCKFAFSQKINWWTGILFEKNIFKLWKWCIIKNLSKLCKIANRE